MKNFKIKVEGREFDFECYENSSKKFIKENYFFMIFMLNYC